MAPIRPPNPCKPSTTADPHAPISTNAPAPAPALTDADTSMPDATSTKKRKRKDTPAEKQVHILHQTTFRKTAWSYFHLVLVTPGTASLPPSTSTSTTPSTSIPPAHISRPTTAAIPTTPSQPPPSSSSLSPLLTSSLLTPPLSAYLGTTGTAIPIDMLRISGRNVFLRVPRQDARAFRASLAGWVGSCGGDEIPGVTTAVGGDTVVGRVGVAWRVVGEGGVLGGVAWGGDGDGDGDGDGGIVFG